jgi:hypothetical protein
VKVSVDGSRRKVVQNLTQCRHYFIAGNTAELGAFDIMRHDGQEARKFACEQSWVVRFAWPRASEFRSLMVHFGEKLPRPACESGIQDAAQGPTVGPSKHDNITCTLWRAYLETITRVAGANGWRDRNADRLKMTKKRNLVFDIVRGVPVRSVTAYRVGATIAAN